MPHDYALAAASLALLWLACALAPPRVRRALLEGLRCLGRHPILWRIPAVFGFTYALFQIAAAALLHWRMKDDLLAWLGSAAWQPAPDAGPLLLAGALPAAERVAAIFTFFTATFPLSAIFALLLLVNFRGLLGTLIRAIVRRLGKAAGIPILALLILSAAAALAKPAVYLFLPEVLEHAPLSVALGVNALSLVFEWLLGVFFLTYLMLTAYAWRLGISFSRARLLHFAMRRTGFVLKWSLALAALDLFLVALPLHAGFFLEADNDLVTFCSWISMHIGRPAVTTVGLLCCPVQAILVFHNESLRQALRDGRRLWAAQAAALLPFLAACYLAFLALEASAEFLDARLGSETAAALGVRVGAAWIEALLAGWFIAAWVSLYKSLTASRKEIPL